jgi:hypothetical protein
MSSKYADLWNQDEKQRKSQQQQQQQPKAVKASYADKWNEGAATPAKRNDSSGGNLATSFLKWLYHPDPVETPISAADRQTMMRTNTGHAQDPVVLPGKQTSAQIRAQQLARQRRNAQEVAQMSPGEVQPSPVKPVYPNGTIGPVKGRTPMELANRSELEKWQDRAHEVQSFIGDPGLYIKNAVDKPIQQTKTVISQLAGDVGKGLTLGALDLDQGKLLGQKVLPTNAEMLQSSGVSQDVANREMTGFKIGDIVPELKGTFFDWDIHPAEWATMGPAVGAASRGLSKITEPVGKFLFSKAPVVLKPLIPTLTRIFNAGLTGSAINTASGLLQGQSAKSIPANAASGFGVGAAFGLVGEGLNTIANAPVAYRANLYKQAVDKMAQWAYGEGKFNSYDEAFQAADNVLSREINSRGGLGNLRPKDLKGFNQAVETMLKKQNRPGVPGDTPRMVDQAIVDSLNSSATNVNQPGIVPKQSQNGAVPVKPMQTSVPVRQPINQPHFPGAPGMFTPIAQPANNMNRQPVRPVQETQTNVPQVQTPPVNVNPVAGQKNGQTKQPWEMTQNEYILSLFSDPENYTDADIENIVHQQNRINHQEILQKEGTDDVQVIIKRWAQKYGIKTPIETTTRDIGSEGLTHTDWKDGKPVKYGINVSKVEPDERLGILRHEFEHV